MSLAETLGRLVGLAEQAVGTTGLVLGLAVLVLLVAVWRDT